MGDGETGAELTRHIDSFIFRQAADAAEECREILAVDVFHADKRNAVGFANVENTADVGVRDLTSDAHFAVETRQRSSVLHKLFRQEFQRYVLIELEVLRAIDFAHAATADKRDNAIAISEQSAGKNASALRAQRGGTAARGR